MIVFFKLNTLMKGFLYIILASILYYFLFEEDYIYYLIDKDKTNKKLMRYLDEQGGVIVNIVFLILYFYLVYKIIPSSFYKEYI